MMSHWPYNYHSHTRYGDGHSDSSDYVAQAIQQGMCGMGISEHAPLGEEFDWTISPTMLDAYRSEVMGFKEQYEGRLEILCGLECDWWPAQEQWWREIDRSLWDYLIGSVHYVTTSGGTWSVDDTPPLFEQGVQDVFGGDIRSACDAFFECERQAASSGRFDILGHFDLVKKFNKGGRYFDSGEPWYRQMALTVVDAAASSGIIVEVSTAGLDKPVGEPYPAPWLIQACVEKNVRLTLNSDAHAASEIQRHFAAILLELFQLGVEELWRLREGQWEAVGIVRGTAH